MLYTHKKRTFWEYLCHVKKRRTNGYFHKRYKKFAENYFRHVPSNRYIVCPQLDNRVASTTLVDLLFDREEIEAILGYMRKANLLNGHAIDVGANYGHYSLYFANYFDHVYAFEPHPVSFSLLDINAKYCNPKQNITAYHYGLSSKEGIEKLYDHNRLLCCATFEHKFAEENTKKTHYVECHLKTLKEEEFRDKKIGFLKIDVEGHELEVLKGAEIFIKNQKPTILIEDWKSKSGKKSDTIKFLENLGYNKFLVPSKRPFRKGRSIWETMKYVSQLFLCNGQDYGLIECDFSLSTGYPHILCESKE